MIGVSHLVAGILTYGTLLNVSINNIIGFIL